MDAETGPKLGPSSVSRAVLQPTGQKSVGSLGKIPV